MENQKRKKLNKILIIIMIILIIIAIVAFTIYYIYKEKQKENSYEDTVVAKRYFTEITIDMQNKEVLRDGEETILRNEFDISEEQENLILSSETELINFFADSTFEVQFEDEIAYIKDKYQTKKIILEANEVKGKFKKETIENIEEIQDGLYILTFDTEKRTKDAYEYLSTLDWIENIELDEVSIVSTISDVSQTVYGQSDESEADTGYKSYGVTAMGLDNFQNIINENGNPSDITVATIGYGACIDNSYFTGRISDNYYNFIEESSEVYETVPQGSRILEVIQESTTHNVKLMPLVVINSENYTTTSSIIRAINYAIQNADVIYYEFVNTEDYMINLVLKNAFKENIPVCCITTSAINEDENYPASNSTTIAVSSLDKSGGIASYSGTGNYMDFAAYSTDVNEIFNSSSVSRWSGSSYSAAHIVSAIALIKTYHKNYTILEVYNELRNYCIDLGDSGKDEKYGYGYPNFSNLKITDLDKLSPEILEVIYNNNDWETSKTVQIKAQDNIRIYGWAITDSDKQPTEWNVMETLTASIDVTGNIEKNGKYYIWVIDSAGNTASKMIEVNKADSTAPTIDYAIDSTTQSTEKYVTIKITATDSESGLNETPYSTDKTNWGSDNKELKVTENGRYKFYVRDAVGNIAEKEIVIDTFDQQGVATIGQGEIIKSVVVSSSWSGDTNKEVRITFNNNYKVTGWFISEQNEVPEYFNNVETSMVTSTNNNNTNQTGNSTNTSNSIGTGNTTNSNTTGTKNTISSNNNSVITGNSSVTQNGTEYEDEDYGYDYVTITVSLKADTQYYAWIKDTQGNVISQAFSVSKVEI